MSLRARLMLLLLSAAVAGCGRDEPAQAPAESTRVVTGVASKGPLQGASVGFFPLDSAGNPSGPALVPAVTTDASGRFTVSGLPAGVPVLASTTGGSYIDESDPEPSPALRRRVDLSGGGGLNAVLPPGATTIALTPYSAALYKKAFIQAAGSNFANTYAAVRTQAAAAFGFDPITTVPANPITGAGGSQDYALLLGASALAINQIALTGTPEHLPAFPDIQAFIDDFADGRLDVASLELLVRRFRNNNIGVYAGVAAPSVDEAALSQPAVVPNSAPTGAPAITGTATEDQTLTATAGTLADADGLGAFSYQWNRNASPISLATASTYLLGDADAGATITVTVSYTDGGGVLESVTSAATAAVANVNDAPAGSPTISGTATENQTLTAVTGGISDADGLGTFGYQWNRNASPIGLATASAYVLGDADVGATITVTVNYTDAKGTAESLTSAPTAAVANVNDAPTGNAVVTGTATEDQTLTADASGIADADGLGAFSYNWYRNGVFVVGATTVYTLGDADVGFAIHVEVSYTDGGGTLETLASTPTAAVANVNDAPTGTVTIDDATPDENQLLTAADTLADADGLGAISYAWQQADDAGFTTNLTSPGSGPTFTPGDAQVGKFLRVLASYTDGKGTAEQVASAVTAAVANVNDPPTLDVNAGLTVDQGNTAVITTLELSASDLDDATSAIQFDVTTPPANGVIEVMGIAASGFTQADLGLGFVAYNHDGSATVADSFQFTLSDASGFSPDCPSPSPCTFGISITPVGGTEAVLPYVTATGDLFVVDPANAGNPILVASGLPTAGFPSETLLRASGTGTTASGIHASMLVYIHDDGSGRKVWRVDLEPGMSHARAQVSNITDACDINGIAEDIRNPLNTILRIDTAGADTFCNTSDDFTTAETYLVPVSTPGASGGTQIGFGNCCGIAGIADANGNLVGVLTTEDDGTGTTFDLNRRNVADLGTPVFTQSLDIAGGGQIYSRLVRGFGDQHIYYRARRSGIDTTYKLLRFNVADNTVTPLFDYGVTDATAFTDDLDSSTFDAANLYFVSADRTGIFKVPHAATGTGDVVPLVSSPGVGSTTQLEQTANRIVFQVNTGQTGVHSVPKAGGAVTAIALDTTLPPAFNFLDTTDNGRVYVSYNEPGGTPQHAARAFPDSGGTPVTDIPDAHWAGKTFTTTCDFSASCEDTIAAQAIFVRLGASGTTADIEIVDPATSTQTGNLFNQIINVSQGPAVFGFGFGRYPQFTFINLVPNGDIWLGDSQAAGPGGPAGSLTLISADTSGDDKWLLFGGDDGGGPAPTCTTPPANLIAWYAGDGNTFDIQSGRNGTLLGSTAFATGQVAQAFSFDGASGSVTVPDDPAWNFGANAFTIDLWANFDDASGSHTLVAHDEGGANPSKWAFMYEAGQLKFQTDSPLIAPTDITLANFTPVLGTWYHLAVTRQGGFYTLYIDGANVAGGTNGNPVPDAVAPLTIGEAAGTKRFVGRIDEVEIFNRELAQAELQAIHDAGSAGKCKPAAASDADGDTLSFALEMSLGTNPNSADTDNDGMSDPAELAFGVNPATYDPGLDTDPRDADTDNDGAGDGLEVGLSGDPLVVNEAIRVSNTGDDANTGTTWDNVPAGTGPVLTNARVVQLLDAAAPYPATQAAQHYVLYDGSASPNALNLADGPQRQFVTFVGSVGPTQFVPAFPPTTEFNGGGTSSTVEASNALNIRLKHVNITSGNAPDGGGVFVHDTSGAATLTLDHVRVHNNDASANGGGVAVTGVPPTRLTLQDSTIEFNAVTSGSAAWGGGAYVNGANLDVFTSTIRNNTATGASVGLARGGGIYATSSATVVVSNSKIQDNTVSTAGGAARGGGIYAGIAIVLTMADSTVSGNLVTGGPGQADAGGGGLWAGTGDSVDITNSVFANNRAANGPGGGINLFDTNFAQIDHSQFLSNSSSGFPGGGLHLHVGTSGNATIFNNLFVGNHSDVTNPGQPGGGVEIENVQAGLLSFGSNTVAYNQNLITGLGASSGLNISVAVPADNQLRNNIVWFNDNADVGSPQAGDNVVVDDGASPVVFGAQSGNNVNESGFSGSINLNPLLTQGFYLAQAGNASVNGGDALYSALFSPGFTTEVGGTEDAGQVDIGFHHQLPSAGAMTTVTDSPPFACGTDLIFFRPGFVNATTGQPGHLIAVEFSGPAGVTLGSLTTLAPRGGSSRLARDLGDGRYSVGVSGPPATGTGTFTIYADDQATPQTFNVEFGC